MITADFSLKDNFFRFTYIQFIMEIDFLLCCFLKMDVTTDEKNTFTRSFHSTLLE
jgi:hypothetical protein